MFDIQRFADTVESSSVLQTKFTFADEDTRTVNIPDPRSDIDATEIQELSEWVVANNVLLGDVGLATSTGIESAIIVGTTRVRLDIKSIA